jgi:hypothetical protein
MGDFERTSQSMANQTRSVGEQFKQLSATLGEQLLPIVNKILSKISELITWFGNLDKGTQKTILIILGITAVIGPLLGIIGGLIKFITILTQATWLWSASLWANPITWIVAGIIILIGAITLLILNFDKLDKNTQNVFKSIGNAFIWMLNLMIDGINKMMALILLPFNLLIKGLNLIPGVKIPSLKLEIPKIPKLETGTNIVPRDMMAQLHQGEAVVPKKFNPAMNKSVGLNNSIKLEMPRQEFDIMLDGNRVGKAITPYVTKTVKLGGGNL